MEPHRVHFASFAEAAPTCSACGESVSELSSLARHVEHLADRLPALEQRQLRSHLFALLAVMSGVAVPAE
jgi:hypothetical protein